MGGKARQRRASWHCRRVRAGHIFAAVPAASSNRERAALSLSVAADARGSFTVETRSPPVSTTVPSAFCRTMGVVWSPGDPRGLPGPAYQRQRECRWIPVVRDRRPPRVSSRRFDGWNRRCTPRSVVGGQARNQLRRLRGAQLNASRVRGEGPRHGEDLGARLTVALAPPRTVVLAMLIFSAYGGPPHKIPQL
jgi:hypothetical protein